jgi:hypothetical protein
VVFNDDYLQWQVGKLPAYRYAFKLYRLIFWGAHHHYPCQPSLSLDYHHTIASTFTNTTMNIIVTTTYHDLLHFNGDDGENDGENIHHLH